MAIINLPLVPPLPTDGQVGDAVPLDATINYIVAQVNANAQATGVTPTLLEWQSLGQTPTFVSATSFTVPGNLTTTFTIGRRLQSVNTGGTIYSTVVSSAFTTVTTVTVLNDSGVLDSGLSVVNIGLLNSVNESLPRNTIFGATFVHNTETFVTTTQLTLSTANGVSVTVSNDRYGEFSAATGTWTAAKAGGYIVMAVGDVTISGVTITSAQMGLIVGGATGGNYAPQPMGITSINPSSAVQPTTEIAMIFGPAGMTVALGITLTFSAGSPHLAQSTMTIVGPL